MEVAKERRGTSPAIRAIFLLRCLSILVLSRAAPSAEAFARSTARLWSPPLLHALPPRASKACVRAKDDYDYDELFRSDAERSRPSRRKVMNDDDWLRHRSSDRFFRNLLTIPRSAIFLNLVDEVAVIAGVCVLTILWNELIFDGYCDFARVSYDPPLADMLGDWAPQMKLPQLPFDLSSGVLGLLLAFRSNGSYTRFLEGREAWGKIEMLSMNMLLMGTVWTAAAAQDGVDGEPEKEQAKTKKDKDEAMDRLGKSTWAFARSLRRHLSGRFDPEEGFVADVRTEMRDYPDQAEGLIGARHRPFRALYDLQRAVNGLPLDDDRRKEISSTCVSGLTDACSTCERLYGTPVPLSYTRHTARFLTIWLVLIPLATYDTFDGSWNHLGMIPAVAVLSFLLFGIEEIAVSLEEPFSILPLEAIVEDTRLACADVQAWMDKEDKEGTEAAALGREMTLQKSE